jgi:hypothetical protein
MSRLLYSLANVKKITISLAESCGYVTEVRGYAVEVRVFVIARSKGRFYLEDLGLWAQFSGELRRGHYGYAGVPFKFEFPGIISIANVYFEVFQSRTS